MALFTNNLLRVTTYNVNGEQDYESMATEFLNNGIDVVALQGIEKLDYDKILRSMKSRGYNNYANPSSPYRKTFEVIFSRLPSKKEYKPFSGSKQSCGLTKYSFNIPIRAKDKTSGDTIDKIIPIVIVTSHLEEGGTGNGNRQTQIQEIDTLTKEETCVIFLGDTSIPSWQTVTLPDGWYDAWREKGSVDTEITQSYDPIIGIVQDRPDRIWYRLAAKPITESNPNRESKRFVLEREDTLIDKLPDHRSQIECIDFMLGCRAGYRHAPIAIFRLG